MSYQFSIPITPQVKQRPRFGSGFIYTQRATGVFERTLKTYFKKFIKTPLTHALRVEIIFNFAKPKKPKYNYPSRGDLDNYVKAVLDSMNEVVFEDDSQVVKSSAEKLRREKRLGRRFFPQ